MTDHEPDFDRILCPYGNEFGGLGVSVWLHAGSTPVVSLPLVYRAAHLELTECGHPNHSQLVISGTPPQLRRFLVDALAALDTAAATTTATAADTAGATIEPATTSEGTA